MISASSSTLTAIVSPLYDSVTNSSSPISVVGDHSFIKIASADAHTIALKADGSLWGWGENLLGNLGDGTSTNKSSPVSVVGNHSFIDISAAFRTSHALKSDGTVWSWGTNQHFQLGTGDILAVVSPVQCLKVF